MPLCIKFNHITKHINSNYKIDVPVFIFIYDTNHTQPK